MKKIILSVTIVMTVVFGSLVLCSFSASSTSSELYAYNSASSNTDEPLYWEGWGDMTKSGYTNGTPGVWAKVYPYPNKPGYYAYISYKNREPFIKVHVHQDSDGMYYVVYHGTNYYLRNMR